MNQNFSFSSRKGSESVGRESTVSTRKRKRTSEDTMQLDYEAGMLGTEKKKNIEGVRPQISIPNPLKAISSKKTITYDKTQFYDIHERCKSFLISKVTFTLLPKRKEVSIESRLNVIELIPAPVRRSSLPLILEVQSVLAVTFDSQKTAMSLSNNFPAMSQINVPIAETSVDESLNADIKVVVGEGLQRDTSSKKSKLCTTDLNTSNEKVSNDVVVGIVQNVTNTAITANTTSTTNTNNTTNTTSITTTNTTNQQPVLATSDNPKNLCNNNNPFVPGNNSNNAIKNVFSTKPQGNITSSLLNNNSSSGLTNFTNIQPLVSNVANNKVITDVQMEDEMSVDTQPINSQGLSKLYLII
jgi:hypothetical protein